MYCPECGADADRANFCPECGTDLRGLSEDPGCAACGSEVPEGAKFCPECGEPAGASAGRGDEAPAAAASAGSVRRTGARGKSGGGQRPPRQPKKQQAKAPPAKAPAKGKAPAAQPARRLSPAVIWGGFGALAVIVILVVVFATSGGGGGATAGSTASQPAQPVAADTSGSYAELVQRANDLYDQGSAKLQSKQYDQGAEYFKAAAKVYAAAWKQKSTDPAVGTDYATALFYSGRIDAAVSQVTEVLGKSPQFQTAWFNKGNYLSDKAKLAEQDGDSKAAEAAYAGARVAYQKAVDLDPNSSSGQQAKQRLSELPQ